eukprot:5348108-Amphidinium_carterae.1
MAVLPGFSEARGLRALPRRLRPTSKCRVNAARLAAAAMPEGVGRVAAASSLFQEKAEAFSLSKRDRLQGAKVF